jgi:hypothetical protein
MPPPTGVGHHRSVGVTGDVDAPLIDRCAPRQVVDGAEDERDVIDVRGGWEPTAAACIPRQLGCVARGERGSVGVHGDEAAPIGGGIELRVGLLLGSVAASRVEADD